jgi:hypothetical protein
MAEETWQTQERPILEAVRAGEIDGTLLDSRTAGAAVGLDETASGWAAQELVNAGYITGVDAGSLAEPFTAYLNLRLTEKGRRAVGQWPPGAAEAFFAELERLIAHEKDPEHRRRLERWLELGREVGADIVGSAIVVGAQVAMGL